MRTYNQRSTIFHRLKFFDSSGIEVIPISLEYIVSDYISAEELVRETVVPQDTSITIAFPEIVSSIVDEENSYEIRVFNWYYTYLTMVEEVEITACKSGEIKFRIRNLFADKT